MKATGATVHNLMSLCEWITLSCGDRGFGSGVWTVHTRDNAPRCFFRRLIPNLGRRNKSCQHLRGGYFSLCSLHGELAFVYHRDEVSLVSIWSLGSARGWVARSGVGRE